MTRNRGNRAARAALLTAACTLAACIEEPGADDCGADEYRDLIGHLLAAVTLPADLDARIVGPDIAVTLDHRPDRLNIWVARSGLIERVYCG